MAGVALHHPHHRPAGVASETDDAKRADLLAGHGYASEGHARSHSEQAGSRARMSDPAPPVHVALVRAHFRYAFDVRLMV